MTFCTKDRSTIGGLKITCHQDGGTVEESGFINLHDGETITLGWNCGMTGEEIRIPRIAQGLTESHIGDSTATRRNRGI